MSRFAHIRYTIGCFLFLFLSFFSVQATAKEVGLPLFRNYTAQDYNAHSVNLDILCDSIGHVYVGNFEGLLVFDGVKWVKLYTPRITRITNLKADNSGVVWAYNFNYLGYVSGGDLQGWDLHTVISDNEEKVASTKEDIPEEIRIWRQTLITENQSADYLNSNGDKQNRVQLDKNTFFVATDHGLIAQDANGKFLYSITDADGLCGNSINSISTDGKGSVWGATNSGLFRIDWNPVLTILTDKQGLLGDVSCIHRNKGILYVGTMRGLYRVNGQHAEHINGMDQMCWALTETPQGTLIASCSDGIYKIQGITATQLFMTHSLCAVSVDENRLLSAELDGIYLHDSRGSSTKVSDLKFISSLSMDANGIVTAQNEKGEIYQTDSRSGKFDFVEKERVDSDHWLELKSADGTSWYTDEKGDHLNVSDPKIHVWLSSFRNHNIQALYLDKDAAWLGGTFGLAKVDITQARQNQPYLPKVIIRSLSADDQNFTASFSTDKYDPLDNVLFSYRLSDKDEWSDWDDDKELRMTQLSYGNYNFSVRVQDGFNNISEPATVRFKVPYPFYMKWWAFLIYIVILAHVVRSLIIFYSARKMRKLRAEQHRMEEEQKRLELLVLDRTAELEIAHAELLRKQKEATVGQLTKGLIDRILNPMNYINNFSHLTLGLTKDLKEDLEDDEDKITPDNYEDIQEILDMMNTNLKKIEEHGQSTTRILKSMEEMLKDRSGQFVQIDLSSICQQALLYVNKYFENPVNQWNIQLHWDVQPDIKCQGINEQLTKSIMSMIANAIYAINKKAERHPASYQPELKLTLTRESRNAKLTLRDNGIGIEESIKDKIFDPFFTTKPTAEAAGVGMYLTREIIENHGGTITLSSEKDQFTEFTVIIPVEA